MASTPIEADYLVVGAGASGMAFADTLVAEDPQARVVIVDRHARPGGHWNDAYPFVCLHQPSAYYGVNSLELAHGRKDRDGLNAGLYDLASGAEVLSYFDQVMRQQLLPSGRVRYLPQCQADADGRIVSLLTGAHLEVRARCHVDATHVDTAVPSTHPPTYRVAEGVRCVPVNTLADLTDAPPAYVVVGCGKTGIDACLWLLERGVAPQAITWIAPRDPWLLDRANLQPGDEFFVASFTSIARQFEALAAASDVRDLFGRLEAAGELLRLDPEVWPSVYRCATITRAELAALRRIEQVVRLGRLRAVEPTRLILERGEWPLPHGALVVDCSANALPPHPPQPVFEDGRITLQMVRQCQPTFSAAFIALVEARFGDDVATKNALCTPIPAPALDVDWLRMLAVNMANRQRWAQHPAIEQWLAASRLDCLFSALHRVRADEAQKLAVVQRYRQAIKPAMANLQRLLATLG